MVNVDDIKGDWVRALELKASGDMSGAFFLFRKIASQGFPYAYLEIAILLEVGGNNLKKNVGEAIKWYTKAVDAVSDEYAIFALGRIYFTGHCVQIDNKKAFQYFYMLKDSKQAGAIYVLGLMSEKGWGTSKSITKAKHYYEKSSRSGHLLALTRLGIVSLKQFRIGFGLGCLWRSQVEYLKIYSKNRKDWRIGIRVLDRDMQKELIYKFSLLN